ncbi:MAG: hypothetical protein LBS01_05310 [Prevotellaceae bacterium]|jgi:hypothetical protein|nr:hypothetical protein [Prevotellaceae bacterium]
MKKSILTLGIIALMSGAALSAQVGINTDNPTATLDIVQKDQTLKGKGFRLDDGNQGAGKILTSDSDGTGTWTPPTQPATWFYLPSFNITLGAIGAGKTLNLYNIYRDQFTRSGNARFVSSDATIQRAVLQPALYTASELIFVVTDYDSALITVNSISDSGVMNYDVISGDVSPTSYINVICIVK